MLWIDTHPERTEGLVKFVESQQCLKTESMCDRGHPCPDT